MVNGSVYMEMISLVKIQSLEGMRMKVNFDSEHKTSRRSTYREGGEAPTRKVGGYEA
jgi:hypothetical protein